ncbi:MAG: hypothetical protein FE044_01400 [Thermoplasmata archaeon]|nr:MAG: hypothetical protein FE044_01400 [Thermoplasmata archaeon]
MKKMLCFLIVILLFIPNLGRIDGKDSLKKFIQSKEITERKIFKSFPSDFFQNILSFILSPNFPFLINFLNDGIDQKQEKSDGCYKIYGNKWYSQSFKNTRGKLTKVEILVNKHIKSLNFLACKKFSASTNDKIGNLTIAIRYELDGKDILNKTFSPDKISKSGDWITFDFNDMDIWVEDTYYIVVRSDGGDEGNYYCWYYGNDNPYERGYAEYSTNAGEEWNSLSNIDFCFRTYGVYSGEEPDGKVERWAVMFSQFRSDPNIGFVKDCLLNHGWKEDHIKMLDKEPTYEDIKSAILWVDQRDDQDDILLLCSNNHGFKGGVALANGVLYYKDLDRLLDCCGARSFYSISACHSGSAIPILGEAGRVIVTACRDYEEGGTAWFLVFLYYDGDLAGYYGYNNAPSPNGAFARSERDLNKDGWISDEEAFPYAKQWTEAFHNYYWNPAHPIHPQMYDGCQSELKITKI